MLLVLLEPLVTGVKLVLLVLLVLLVPVVALASVVRLVLLAPTDLLVLLALLGNLVLKEREEPKGLRVKTVPLVPQVLLDLLAHPVPMAPLALPEVVVMVVPLVLLVSLVLLDVLVLLDPL